MGDGDGTDVAGLFDRDGTVPVPTDEGDVGSTEPQSIVTSATASEAMTMAMRMSRRIRKTRTRWHWAESCTAAPRSGAHAAFDAMSSNELGNIFLVRRAKGGQMFAIAVLALLACVPAAAAAQTISDPNRGNITFTGNFDVVNAYLFRGLVQDDTQLIMWPNADAGIRLYSGNGTLTDAVLHVGTWNSLHTGVAGLDGPTHRLWYESDFYSSVAFTFAPGFNAVATYTAYTSPNSSFSTVKELSFKASADDGLVYPYALIAFELDTHPGFGQADGGLEGGRYLELGVAPRWIAFTPVSLAFPIRVGLSLHNYYELAGVDHPFGFLSLGAIASVPFATNTSYGAWNVHGGIEFYSLGDTPEAFNGGEQQKLVASVGVGFSY